MNYSVLQQKLDRGDVVILDGGTGTELERRGVPMDANAWCGPATLGHLGELQAVHQDYIKAGADIITTNTFASSPLMLNPAGFGDRFEEINRAAIRTAHRARAASGRPDIAVAGSLSHMLPVVKGSDKTQPMLDVTEADMVDAFSRLASLHVDEGCDLILLEMMYHPDRMRLAFDAAIKTGLPVWAGLSTRRGENGEVLTFCLDQDIPLLDAVQVVNEFDVAAAGIMHAPSNIIADALATLRSVYDGPLMAYPDSGYFKMPKWQFDAIIPPDEFRGYADDWVASGVQVIGGCCGLSPVHIEAIATLKKNRAADQHLLLDGSALRPDLGVDHIDR